MRRSIFALSIFTSFALVACEDGPNQTYNPASPNAAAGFNNGGSGPSFDQAKAPFTASYAGKSRQEICGAEEKALRWAHMLNEPIIPPRKYAGLDMAKSDMWEGLTIEDAEQPEAKGGNCQARQDGGNGSKWGDNGEVEFFYDIGTHIVTQMVLNRGYTGQMKFKSRPMSPFGDHTYALGISVINKDDKQMLIDWGNADKRDAEITELYDAAIWTFGDDAQKAAPTLPNCNTAGQCLVFNDAGDGSGIFGFRPLAFYLIVPNTTSPQPTPSKPQQMYNFYIKNMPYSNAPLTLKLDAEGPVASQTFGTKTCSIKLGLKWKDFLGNCVQVSDVATVNATNLNKLLGGRTHDLENWEFNVIGINQNFTKVQGDFDVVKDVDVPTDQDVATNWTFDVRAKGKISNDVNSAGKLDLHGTGTVFAEYLRLVQNDISSKLPVGVPRHTLGDGACLQIPPAAKAAGCTGLEGFMIPGPVPATMLPSDPRAQLYAGIVPGIYNKSFLSPGDPKAYICDDPMTQSSCESGALWDQTFQRVIEVLGHGDVFDIPSDIRDRRYFFRQYAIALVKYMKASAQTPIPTDISGIALDYESLFFDNNFVNQFDKAEYVERTFIDNNHPVPLDFEYGSDVKVGNQRYSNFFSKFSRPEKAMYTTMLPKGQKGAHPGSVNNVMLTNLFGSPVLSSVGWSSHHCATTVDRAKCNHLAGDKVTVLYDPPPPMNPDGSLERDLNGNPVLTNYPGVFGQTVWAMGSTAIKLVDEPNAAIQAAKVEIPNYADPYDSSSAATPLQVLVPWLPKQPGVGFSIPLSGTRDKFISTAQLDFSGTTTTINVDYEFMKDAMGQPTKNITVLAMETQDFLGDVFMCQDPVTGDLLHPRMYTSTGTILDWINNHPGTADACSIIVRYSPFNNYPDFITSVSNGVKLNLSQGFGFGRVVDATLFNPALAQ